ncbi:MAG: hypothetical protein R3F59_03530 [Myxococcota bacterium]
MTLLPLLLAGCTPQYEVLLSVASEPPLPVSISTDGIEIPEGIAAAVTAYPYKDGEPLGDDTEIDFVVEGIDVDVVDVTPVSGAFAGAEDADFVVVGVSLGEAELVPLVDDHAAAPISVRVVPQPD